MKRPLPWFRLEVWIGFLVGVELLLCMGLLVAIFCWPEWFPERKTWTPEERKCLEENLFNEMLFWEECAPKVLGEWENP